MYGETEIAIVGAGPVGLALALALSRSGIAVRVLEKRPGLSAASRASTFHPPTLDALHGLGVLAPLLPGGVRVDRILWRQVEDGASASLDLGILAGETGFPFRWHREQQDLTPALLAALPEGCVRFAAGVIALAQDAEGVTLRAADGSTLRARYAVGCDGASGALRGLAGIGVETSDYAHRVLRLLTPLDLRTVVPGLDGLGYLADAEGTCSLLRMPAVWRLIFRIPPAMSDEAAMAEDHARARIARFLPEARDLEIAGRDVYGVQRAMATACRAGRVLLAGDAAHLTNTRGGMNMNAGIHDAMTLAATLERVLDGGEDRLLDHWAEARLRVVREALLPRTDSRVAAAPGAEVARMAGLSPAQALDWAREASMLDIATAGTPA
ncbi:FAD-dependent oxidoreductase [Falsiroseomonas selenitidurans]|uniref:NAD(P)-binding protein n=1 Tax=Falsiroseomonas selenitidurans TaxID=2716335 RepID=A0ABX1E3F4_9PROT|nr:FAD-dependent monooxygenase [Falsiroseomonas selenitidurans]NKC31712.1 NAD(P)-binding protein [Falsiroseomonas selenitidurans]